MRWVAFVATGQSECFARLGVCARADPPPALRPAPLSCVCVRVPACVCACACVLVGSAAKLGLTAPDAWRTARLLQTLLEMGREASEAAHPPCVDGRSPFLQAYLRGDRGAWPCAVQDEKARATERSRVRLGRAHGKLHRGGRGSAVRLGAERAPSSWVRSTRKRHETRSVFLLLPS